VTANTWMVPWSLAAHSREESGEKFRQLMAAG
jgi:hypothetical protein